MQAELQTQVAFYLTGKAPAEGLDAVAGLGLRPAVLDDLGLVAALRQLGDDLQASTGAQVDMQVSRLAGRLPPQIENALARILQEALANATRHAGVTRFEVSARADRRHIIVQVRDHGKGFNVAKVLKKEIDVGVAGGHFGLRGMRDRVAIMNGKMSIRSGRTGTVVTIQLPVS